MKWSIETSPSLYICSAAFWAEALQSITSDNNLHLLIGMHQAENNYWSVSCFWILNMTCNPNEGFCCNVADPRDKRNETGMKWFRCVISSEKLWSSPLCITDTLLRIRDTFLTCFNLAEMTRLGCIYIVTLQAFGWLQFLVSKKPIKHQLLKETKCLKLFWKDEGRF